MSWLKNRRHMKLSKFVGSLTGQTSLASLLAVVIGAGGFALLAGFIALGPVSTSMATAVSRDRDLAATVVATQLGDGLAAGDIAQVQSTIESLVNSADHELLGVTLTDSAGKIIRSFGSDTDAQHLSVLLSSQVNDENPTSSHTKTRSFHIARVTDPATGTNLGHVALVFPPPYASFNATAVLAIGGAAAFVWALLFWLGLQAFLKSRLVTPLRQLSEKAADATSPAPNGQHAALSERTDDFGDIARHIERLGSQVATDATARRQRRVQDEQKNLLFSELSNCLSAVSLGDMSPRIDVSIADPLDAASKQVCEDFNKLMARFGEVLATAIEASDRVSEQASFVQDAANTQSQRAETQASTLEESSIALEGLSKSVKQAADDASLANTEVTDTQQQAETGGDIVNQAVAAMNEIESSASKVTQIVSVIDDIAFQTSLLALNAGVEAARAGEAGRGFAIVAQEVRELAQRASESANEIKILISQSSEQVANGAALVGQTGQALTDIIGRFSVVSELVSRIASSLRAQSDGLQEISSGITDLDKVAQENTLIAENTTRSSHLLNREADSLSASLANFKNITSLASHEASTGNGNTQNSLSQPSDEQALLDQWDTVLKESSSKS